MTKRKIPVWAAPLCRLWKRDDGGNWFLAGRLGGARVLVYPNYNPRDGDDATHILCFAPPLDDVPVNDPRIADIVRSWGPSPGQIPSQSLGPSRIEGKST
jgi:hypothetical protein